MEILTRVKCQKCGGTGKVPHHIKTALGDNAEGMLLPDEDCSECGGSGYCKEWLTLTALKKALEEQG